MCERINGRGMHFFFFTNVTFTEARVTLAVISASAI